MNTVCFRSCGFNSAITLKHFDEEDMICIETFLNDRLLELSRNSETDVIKFFGSIPKASRNSFEFSRGEQRLIKEISSYIKCKIDEGGVNSNVAYFNEPLDVSKEKTVQKCYDKLEKTPTLTHYFLNELISTANRNSQLPKGGYRYNINVRSFATNLRMIAGPLAYETLQRNLECALPSLPSTNRYVQKSNCHVTEGILRTNELVKYLEERDLPFVVSLSEDATKIINRPQYDSKSNQIVGMVLPSNAEHGMPIPYSYRARDAQEMIRNLADKNPMASFVNVIMAQPIATDRVAPFCLLIFGSDNKYTGLDVQKRWKYIINELHKVGIKVIAVASDSDPKYNSSMRKLAQLGNKSNLFESLTSDHEWFKCGGVVKNSSDWFHVFVQDPTHIATKLRNFFLRTTNKLEKMAFGTKYFIQLSHLRQLLENYTKDVHQLTATILNPIDKQNFQSAQRMCDPNVIELLRKNVRGGDGTAKFLEIMRNVIDAYMNLELTPLERVNKMWYTIFIIRMWRKYIYSNKNLSNKSFLTHYCYACIELNAHSMVLALIQLKNHDLPELFQPQLFDSQPCESTFRQIRSFTSTYSTVANCTVKEILGRLSKIQLQNDISSDTNSQFIYPRLARNKQKYNTNSLPDMREIFDEIELCKKQALRDGRQLGLIDSKNASKYNFDCEIAPYMFSVKPKKRKKKAQMKKKSVAGKKRIKIGSKRLVNMKKMSKRKQYIRKTTERPKLNLRMIALKNYAEKFEGKDVEPDSPYVEVYRDHERRIIVKKTSFVWLLRKEPARLSSDRLQRVRTSAKSNQTKNKTLN